MDTVQTPLAEWRQREDGSWEIIRQRGAAPGGGGGNGGPGPGGSFGPTDIAADDNVVVVQVPGGVVIRQGGHMVLFETNPLPWQPALDFQGAGVEVTDDPANNKTNILINDPGQSGHLIWRDEYQPGVAYRPGDVVKYSGGVGDQRDWLYVFTGPPFAFGYGFGGYGDGPYGEVALDPIGFGVDPFGVGAYGGG